MAEQTDTSAQESCPVVTTPEQILYAKVLRVGMSLGLVTLAVTFVIYVFGIMEPHTPVEDLASYYTLPADQYLERACIRPGWGWFTNFGAADCLNYLGILILGGTTVACFLAVLPGFIKRGDKIYAAMAVLEIIVLVLAASGVLTGGR